MELEEYNLDKIQLLRIGQDKYSMRAHKTTHTVVLSQKSLKKFLKKIRSSDCDSVPRSIRNKTYKLMALDIGSQKGQFVYAPRHLIKNLPLEIREDILEDIVDLTEKEEVIKSMANKSGKSEKEVEKLWNNAKEIASDTFGKKEKDFKDKEYAYAMGVLKNSLGIKEAVVEDFLESKLAAKDFLEK